MASIQVFLVTGHEVLRDNLGLLLEAEDMVLCGSASDPAAALGAMPAETDLVIVGPSAGGQGSLRLVEEMAARAGSPPVLVLAVDAAAHTVRRALAAGARGYVSSRGASTALVQAIREVAAGRTYVPQPGPGWADRAGRAPSGAPGGQTAPGPELEVPPPKAPV
jgi:two-component system, NarL family, response regulator DevR